MAKRSEQAPVYDVFNRFLKTCILGDHSLLWPTERAWTEENVAKVKQWLVDTPILGDKSFEEKLQEQMKDAGPHHWMILGDVFFVYLLPSSYIRFDNKQGHIRWIVEQGGLPEPSYEDEIWEAQKAGFTRTSQKYHSKYGQFWILLLFADHLKSLDDPEKVLSNHQRLQSILDTLLEKIEKGNRAYDMRHAILYMAFPEEYERIISTSDKRKIIRFYSNRLELPVPSDMDDLGALDEAIRNIRKALASQYD